MNYRAITSQTINYRVIKAGLYKYGLATDPAAEPVTDLAVERVAE